MKISELEPNAKVVNLVGKIEHLDEPSQTPTGIPVQEGIISDETGQVKISLWSEQVGVFSQGDRILITAGWAKTFNNEMQVSSGKFGKIQRIQTGEKT